MTGATPIVTNGPMSVAWRLVCLSVVLNLTGCSAGLEKLRPTYDEGALYQAQTRPQIEDQLGKASGEQTLVGGDVEATYRTSKVSKKARDSLVAAHIMADGLTFGLAELFHPAFIGENEVRTFSVVYNRESHVKSVASICDAARSNHAGRMSSGWHNEQQPCVGGAVPL